VLLSNLSVPLSSTEIMSKSYDTSKLQAVLIEKTMVSDKATDINGMVCSILGFQCRYQCIVWQL
jgi:hypothetical protein